MNSAWARTIVRLLAALMIWSPFQLANAGMIGTDRIVASSASTDRAALVSFVTRADVAKRLQAFGVNPATAKDRVAAMTDQEVRYLAGQIQSAPAGADNTAAAVLVIVVIAAVVWWAWYR